MDLVEEDILMHYGVKRRSGRYPWGSGDNPYQHGGDFLARVEELQRLGKTEKQIADELHLSTTDLRMQVRVAKHERRALQADRARSLREDGKTLDEIASILGYANDSSVRALLNENTAANKNKAQATAEILKKELAEKGAIDVGTGVERQLGVSTGVLQEALFILETEGYNRYGVGVPQVNDPKKRTITPVISVPEIDQREVYQNLDLVKSVGDYHSTDGGESWDKREYPASIDSSRVKILYGDEGGALKDGVIEIRRGVADLDLGDSHYAQVRRIVEDLFRRHLITDSVIHIHVQRLLRLWKFLPQKNTLSGECVKNSSFLCCQKSHIGVRDFIVGVIDPVILTRTKEGVLTFKVGMPVEVHSIPPLYFPDTQSERMTYRSSSRHSSPDLGASWLSQTSYIRGRPTSRHKESTDREVPEFGPS
jgi:AraC-like DNA-binding protein